MNIFKNILLWILNIVSVPLTILTATGVVWYILPLGEGLEIYDFINTHTTMQLRFWITVGSGFLLLLTFILQLIFGKYQKSRVRNFFIHLNTFEHF